MPHYEYRVIPAPDRGLKAKGFRTAEARFANALQTLMNEMGMRGWEYQRAETLPATERTGIATATTEWRNMLIFRRSIAERPPLVLKATERLDLPKPAAVTENAQTDYSDAFHNDDADTEPSAHRYSRPGHPEDDASKSEGALRMLRDNGVEDHSDVAGLSNALMQLAKSRNNSKSTGS